MTAPGVGSKPDADAVKTIVSAVYPAMLNEPATVRARAQAAYTIANTIAAALITAGVLAHVREFGAEVQWIGVAAVAAWMLTAAFFINISRRVRKIPRAESGTYLTVDEFVRRSLNIATDEADALDGQLAVAAWATYGALGLTAMALLAALISPPAPDRPLSTIRLTSHGADSIKAQCPSAGAALTGLLHPETLDDAYAIIDVTDACGGGTVTIRIPPRYIAAVKSVK